jgi:hypothetical protein
MDDLSALQYTIAFHPDYTDVYKQAHFPLPSIIGIAYTRTFNGFLIDIPFLFTIIYNVDVEVISF